MKMKAVVLTLDVIDSEYIYFIASNISLKMQYYVQYYIIKKPMHLPQ